MIAAAYIFTCRQCMSAMACLVFLFGLVGCGGNSTNHQEIVRFWAMGREAEVVAELLPQFERENPHIRVELQQIPWTAAHEKLLTAFAAEALPDVCQLGNTWIPEFAALNALTPLETLIADSNSIEPGDYFPGIWDTNVVDGKTYGVPWYVDTRLLFYRKDILKKAGFIQPPRTWSEWKRAMAAIKRDAEPNNYAILLPLNEFEPQLSLALQSDDPLLQDHNRYGNFQSVGFRRALAFYAEIFEQGWAPPFSETQVSNVWDEFFGGSYAFYLSGPWNIREFRKRAPAALKDQWGTMPLPGPDGPGAGIAGGTGLVLFRTSQRKQSAWRLIEFLSRPEIQRRFHGLIGNLPPRRSAWDDPGIKGDPLAQAFAAQLERVKPVPKVLEWERIAQEIRLTTERVVRGGQPQDAATKQLNTRVDEILAKRRWVMQRVQAEQ